MMAIYDPARQLFTLPAYRLVYYSPSGAALALGLAQDELLNALLTSGVGEDAFFAARQWLAVVHITLAAGGEVEDLGATWVGILGATVSGGWVYDIDVRDWVRGGAAALRTTVESVWGAIRAEIEAGDCDGDALGMGIEADRVAHLAHLLALLARCEKFDEPSQFIGGEK